MIYFPALKKNSAFAPGEVSDALDAKGSREQVENSHVFDIEGILDQVHVPLHGGGVTRDVNKVGERKGFQQRYHFRR